MLIFCVVFSIVCLFSLFRIPDQFKVSGVLVVAVVSNIATVVWCLHLVKGESGVQSHSDLDGVGSIPAIPNARYVPSLLCHERFNEASLPVYHDTLIAFQHESGQ